MTWTSLVTDKTNRLIRQFSTRPKKLPHYHRWASYIQGATQVSLDLHTRQEGETYSTRVLLSSSKKAQAQHRAVFQSYDGFLQRKAGKKPHVDDVARFIAFVVLTKKSALMARTRFQAKPVAGQVDVVPTTVSREDDPEEDPGEGWEGDGWYGEGGGEGEGEGEVHVPTQIPEDWEELCDSME